MALQRKLVLFTVVVLLLGLGVSASALTTYLTGDGTISSITCNATVTQALGIYTYSYELIYTAGTSDVHVFSVENPTGSIFSNAANVPAGANQFTDPTFSVGYTWIDWIDGVLPVGSTATFSYQSLYAPQEIEVYTYVIDGGDYAVGTTLGMGDKIPEPSSLAALLFGAVGLVPLVIRRRK